MPRIIDQGGQGDRTAYNREGIKKAAQKGLVDSSPNFQSLSEVGNISVSWTLGKMVLEVSTQLSGHSSSNPSSTSIIHTSNGIRASQSEELKPRSTISKLSCELMVILGLVMMALAILVFYSFPKSRRRSGREVHPEQGSSSILFHETISGPGEIGPHRTRSSSPTLLRKPSLTSTRRNFFSFSPTRLIHLGVSRVVGIWPTKSAPTHKPVAVGHSNSSRSIRPERLKQRINQPRSFHQSVSSSNPYESEELSFISHLDHHSSP